MECYFIIKMLIELVILVSIIIIIVSLSSKNPLDSHIIGNITNYFNYFPNITSFENFCECDNETLNHSCTEENILQGCFNESSKIIEYKHLFIRKLESKSFCEDMQESFVRNEDKMLSYIFSLNYIVIRRLSIAILVVTLSFIVLGIIVEELKKSVDIKDYPKTFENKDEKKMII